MTQNINDTDAAILIEHYERKIERLERDNASLLERVEAERASRIARSESAQKTIMEYGAALRAQELENTRLMERLCGRKADDAELDSAVADLELALQIEAAMSAIDCIDGNARIANETFARADADSALAKRIDGDRS